MTIKTITRHLIQGVFALFVAATLTLATAEVVKANGEARSTCNQCTGYEYCVLCCGSANSICFPDGQCLCG